MKTTIATIAIAFSIVLASCSNKSETSETANTTDSTAVQVDTVIVKVDTAAVDTSK